VTVPSEGKQPTWPTDAPRVLIADDDEQFAASL
jgi:hypothetical protein